MQLVWRALLLSAVSVGCARQADNTATAPEKTGPVAVEQKGRHAASADGRVEQRLTERLPPGHRGVMVHHNEEEDDDLLYEVTWERPGLKYNIANFTAKKAGAVVTVSCWGSQWVYEKGKLKTEKAAEDTPPQQWDWLKKRADEVAEATYKAGK